MRPDAASGRTGSLFLKAFVSLAALLLLSVSAVSAAATEASPASENAVGDDVLRAAIVAALAAGETRDCAGVLAKLDPLVPQVRVDSDRAIVQRLRLGCLAATNRIKDIPAVHAELTRLLPRDGLVRAFGILLATDQGRLKDATDQLVALAGDSPKDLNIITGYTVRNILQQLGSQKLLAERGRVLIALARTPWEPSDLPGLQQTISKGAIEALLDDKRIEEAQQILARVELPELLVAMATDRRYAPIWSQIEERLGNASGDAIDHYAVQKLDAYSNGPEGTVPLREAMHAFLLLGRYRDAIELSEGQSVRAGMDDDAVMIVLYRAQALSALGRRKDAADVMRGFATIDLQSTPDAAVGLVGLAELLDEAGMASEALQVARDAAIRGKSGISEFGLQWLLRTEACALGALGRAAEAKAVGDRLKATQAANPAAAIEGLLCLRRNAEASAIAVETLKTAEGAAKLIDQFQPERSTWAPHESRLRALWTVFLNQPEVKAAFEKRGRLLPKRFWPDSKPRTLPHTGYADKIA